MNPMKRRKDTRAMTSAVLIVLIAVLMVSASSVVVLLYTGSQNNPGPKVDVVNKGDSIKVDYIGRLADGRVFDTSSWDVANNDALYPKSVSFSIRAQSAYTPLQFVVGSGQLIKGFDNGVIGMAKGDSKVITVLPEDGYGFMNASRLFVMPLWDVAPVKERMNFSEFSYTYGVSPEVGLMVEDPVYGWDIIVIEASSKADLVQVWNTPIVGHQYAAYGEPDQSPSTGWYVEVVSMDTSADGGNGMIIIKNLLANDDAGKVSGYDLSRASTFYVDEVDELEGTFRMNYNGELLGKTLFFTVTLVAIL